MEEGAILVLTYIASQEGRTVFGRAILRSGIDGQSTVNMRALRLHTLTFFLRSDYCRRMQYTWQHPPCS